MRALIVYASRGRAFPYLFPSAGKVRLMQAFCQCNSDCDGDCKPDMPDQSISPNSPEKVTRFVASMEWKDWATCQDLPAMG